jgi:hypothetical protein
LFFQALALGENLLGSVRVLPEIGLGYLLLERLELAAAGRSVKENSAVRGCGFSIGRIRVAVLQACQLQELEVRSMKPEGESRGPHI